MQAVGTSPAGLTLRAAPRQRQRLAALVLLLTACFLGLTGRLSYLQIVRHRPLGKKARDMATSYAPLRGIRGDIRTRDGTLLAREVIEYTVALDPGVLSPENLPRAVDLICRGVGLGDEERMAARKRLEESVKSGSHGSGRLPRYLPLKRGVQGGLAEELRRAAERILPTKERRGVIFAPIHVRQYPRGTFLGAVVGSTRQGPAGHDLEGAGGLELALERTLAGRDGERRLRCEGRRIDRWFCPREVDIRPVHGYNAILTIDSHIQGVAEEELERGLLRENAAAGTVVVMECRTGDILAMVNLPSLDPNRFHDYPPRELEERRKNRAVEHQYEPGSTLKPFVAAMALERKLCAADERIWNGGRVAHFSRRRVEDVSDHGPLSLADAVVFSSNIGMAVVGLKLGRQGLTEALERFRFQEPTGIGLPGEARGKRTARAGWSETYTSISVSFGYEVTVTPIQLCAAFSSLVNGGRLHAPRIVERLERGGESLPFPRKETGRPIGEDTSRRMREILVQVVERGTARALKIPGLAYGGKTGTALIAAGRNGYAGKEYVSSFLAFAPADDPRLVVLAMIERPRIHYYGSTVAGPVVQAILERTFHVTPPRAPQVVAGGGSPRGGVFPPRAPP